MLNLEDCTNTCILINSCPKYNYLAVISVQLIRRYAPDIKWPLYVATTGLSEKEEGVLKTLAVHYVNQTEEENTDFIESRIHSLRFLQNHYSSVLLLQDDFFLDRNPLYTKLYESVKLVEKGVSCARLMPCPGPTGEALEQSSEWKWIQEDAPYLFSFQAGLWSLPWLIEFFEEMVKESLLDFPKYKCKKNHYWLTVNPCETAIGVSVCKRLGYKAVGFGRAGPWSNAVFLSPWPYRPTAVEKGVIQPWAKEMIKREGF